MDSGVVTGRPNKNSMVFSVSAAARPKEDTEAVGLQRATSTTDSAVEPLTPELALVDPELSRRAREQLPDRPPSIRPLPTPTVHRRRTAGPSLIAAHRSAAQPATPVAVVVPEPEPVPSRRRPRRTALTVAALLLLAAAAFFGLTEEPFRGGQSTREPSALEPDGPSPSGDSARPRAERATGRPADGRERKDDSAREGGVRGARKAEQKPASAVASSRTARSAARRVFIWLPVKRASHYNVEFFRGRTKVFQAWPANARLVVRDRGRFAGRQYRLRPGRYRWIVRPGFGPRSSARYGQPIVRSVWTLAPRTARN